MYNLILGNFFSFLSASCTAISVTKKRRVALIYWQIIDVLFCIFSCIFLATYSALITSIIALFRNILSFKNKLDLKSTILLTVLCIIVGVIVNNRGIFGIIAIAASASYTVFMYTTKTSQQMRYAVIINLSLWFIHDWHVQAYPAVMTELALITWTVFQILRQRSFFRKKFLMGVRA